MFRFFLNCKISTRFGLILGVPLGALIFVLISLIIEKSDDSTAMKELRNLAHQAPVISDLVHEFQKERGASAGFVSSGGTQFKVFLAKQQNITDAKVAALLAQLEDFNTSIYGDSFAEKMGVAKFSLSQLVTNRYAVKKLVLSSDQITQYYTTTIARLLAIIEEMTRLSNDAEITTLVTAYTNFLQGKERVGLERAVGAIGFSSGTFTPAIWLKFARIITEQNGYFKSFYNYTQNDQKVIYEKLLSGPVFVKADKFRTTVLNSQLSKSLNNISAVMWFDAVSAKIDNLKIIENMISQELLRASDQKLSEVEQSEFSYIFIAVFILILTGFLTFKLTRGITNPLDQVAMILAEIEGGNLNIDLSEFEMHGEIGRIFSGLEKFKHSLLELHESEDSKNSILEGALDAIISLNKKGEVIEYNASAKKIFGFTKEQVLGKSLEDFIIPGNLREKHRLGMTNFAQTGRLKSQEKRFDLTALRADGTTIDIELSITHAADRDFVTAFIRDVTARKKVERELGFQKFALDEHAIVSTADRWGNITYVNDKFCSVSEYDRAELIGQNHRVVKSDEHSKEFYKELWDSINGGETWQGEIKNKKKNGGSYWVYSTIVPFSETPGEPLQFVSIHTDITERKLAQTAIEKSKAELELRVEARTVELQTAKMLAEKANNAKSDFLSAMSHELRTPMNAILGFSQFLQQSLDDPLSESQKESVAHILTGGKHLLDLIDDVLDLSKIEAGKIEISMESVSVLEVLAECIIAAKNLDETVQINLLDHDFPEKTILVKSDLTRLRQVLLNLISNAVKYNRKNGSVEIRLKKIEEDKLRILVKDTGFGIPADKQRQLFEPFNRLGAESTGIEGTGIGLSIAQRLIEFMGGEIGFESEVDIGSTFWIDILLSRDEENPEESNTQLDQIESRREVIQSNDRKSILYIEDNPLNLALMEKIIGQFDNLILHSAHTAELGLDVAANEIPDLIFMDINLPGMDGLEATKRLLENDATKHIPVIGLSARAFPRDIKKGLDAGLVRYLTKPMAITEIVDTISEYIAGIEQPKNADDH